jgi:hypothetical protein
MGMFRCFRGFEKHGAAAIEKVRTDKPDAYLKVIAGLLPKDLNLHVRQLDDLSDEQLLVRLALDRRRWQAGPGLHPQRQ